MKKYRLLSEGHKRFSFLLLLLLSFSAIQAQVLHTEGFEGASFPPVGWQQGGDNTSYLFATATGAHPNQTPHTGTGEVEFNSYSLSSGSTLLISPSIDWSNLGTDSAAISFWFYRDGTRYNTTDYDEEGVALLVNTSPTDAGATQLGFIPRRIGEAPIEASTGWYQYTFFVPRSFNTNINYFLFEFTSDDGDNCYLDDVSWQSFATACTGTPTAGTISSGVNPVCPSVPLNLTLQNSTVAGGISLQWQSSADSINWVNMANDTLTTLADTITAEKFYRVVATCFNSGLADTSVAYHETVNPGHLCYCAEPAIGGATACDEGYDINNVSITSTTLFTSLVCNINNGFAYTQFPDQGSSTASLSAPGTYTMNVVCTDEEGFMAAWIDFNQDGVFSPSENIFLDVNTTGGIENFTFQIPSNAVLGATGLRIRATSGTLTAADACTNLDDGETEDYVVHIVSAAACGGTPVAGVISSDINPACASATFNLTPQNITVAGGLKYQWQSSADSLSWSDLTNDTANTLTLSNLAASTFYRLIVTCTISGLADTSAGYQEILNSYANCYCAPQSDCTEGDVITNVTFAGINNNSDCGGNGYTAYDSMAVVTKTLTYPISVSVDDGGTENAYVWIDYNHDGVFDSTEFTAIGSGEGGVTFTNNIYIPGNALTGITRMRVRDQFGDPLTGTDACTVSDFGETEDYLVNIQIAPTCTNPPVPGNITGSNTTCPGNSVTLSLVNQTLGTSLQWQTSTDSVLFTDISGANTNVYTTGALTDSVYYRVKVICADSAYTPVFKVAQSPAYLCSYCDASGADCEFGDVITNVTFAGINNNTDCASNAYALYSSPVGQVQQLTAYPISVTIGDDFIEGVAVWIDYDHSGTFDPSEYTLIGTGNNETLNSTITIPATALLGPTVMRVRLADDDAPENTDACTEFFEGETEDYMINIGAAPPCNATPVAGTIIGPDTVLANAGVVYVDTGFTGKLQWLYSNTSSAGPFSALAGDTGSVLNYAFTTAGNSWLAVVASGAGCYPDTSASFLVFSILHGDNVCDAAPLHFGANGPFSTLSASVEVGEPTPPGDSCQVQGYWCNTDLQNSLWFTFVAPASGRISINTISFDTKLAVWDAATCDTILHGGATLLGASDDDPDYDTHGDMEYSSYIDSITCLTPGKVYYVQLVPYGSPGDTTSIELRDLGPGPVLSFTLAPYICRSHAPITLSNPGGLGTFSGPGVTNNIFNPVAAGVGGPYIIEDSIYGCYKAFDTISVSSNPAIIINSVTNVNCKGDSTGAAKVTVSNGTAPYTLNWSNHASGDSIYHLAAGSYTLTVTDSVGCTSPPGSISILQPATAVTATAGGFTNVICPGSSTGTDSVVAAGGTGPYNYIWSNGATTSGVTGLAAGNYTVTVSDSLHCTATPVQLQITQPDTLVVLVNTLTDVSTCYGDSTGALHISATGGNGGYLFAWSTGATTATITGLAAGPYIVTATDALGCSSAPDTITVGQPDSISVVVDSVVGTGCQGGSTGSVNIHVAGGTSPYTYLWSNGGTTQNITHLTAQAYSVTITDSRSCRQTASFAVTLVQNTLTVTTTIVNQALGALGSITQVPNGGYTPYTYAWSNGATTQNLTGIEAGIYVSTVTDAAGCMAITSDTVKLLPTGIDVIDGSLVINIFPNPTPGDINIDLDLDKAENITLQIYDMSGRLVKYDEQDATLKARFIVNLEAEAAGVYLAKIKAGENLITRRIVLTR